MDTGFAHQDFVLHLSRSGYFAGLAMLDFGDYNQRYMDDYPQECVPFEHYVQLFQSNAFRGVHRLNLRNSALSAEQLARLRTLRKDLQLYLIQTHGEYTR